MKSRRPKSSLPPVLGTESEYWPHHGGGRHRKGGTRLLSTHSVHPTTVLLSPAQAPSASLSSFILVTLTSTEHSELLPGSTAPGDPFITVPLTFAAQCGTLSGPSTQSPHTWSSGLCAPWTLPPTVLCTCVITCILAVASLSQPCLPPFLLLFLLTWK